MRIDRPPLHQSEKRDREPDVIRQNARYLTEISPLPSCFLNPNLDAALFPHSPIPRANSFVCDVPGLTNSRSRARPIDSADPDRNNANL